MRGMLVNDYEAVLRLSDNLGVGNLTACDAKREAAGLRDGFGCGFGTAHGEG
jgi:hypothetical protein